MVLAPNLSCCKSRIYQITALTHRFIFQIFFYQSDSFTVGSGHCRLHCATMFESSPTQTHPHTTYDIYLLLPGWFLFFHLFIMCISIDGWLVKMVRISNIQVQWIWLIKYPFLFATGAKGWIVIIRTFPTLFTWIWSSWWP